MVKILSLSTTGLAVISLISKLLKEDIFEAFSDQMIFPVSYKKAIISPLLKGAIIIFSIAAGTPVCKLFLSSKIV